MRLKIWHKMIIGISIPSFIVLLGGLLTYGYINDVESRQKFVRIADELKDNALEVRRREKIFLHFKDAVNLEEVRLTLSVFLNTVNNIVPDVVEEIGEKDVRDLRMSLDTYTLFLEDLYRNFSRVAEISERVRAEGRKLETFVSEGSHARELSTSFVLHLRLLEKNYMLFRNNDSRDKLTGSLKLFHNIMPICFECDPYADSIKTLIRTYEKSDSITKELQFTGDRLEHITSKAAARERQRISAFLSKTRNSLLIVLILLCVIGPLFVYKTSAYVVAPIKRLAIITRRIAEGDTSVRAPLRELDETYELSQSFNTMLDKLRSTHHSLSKSMDLLKEKQAQLVESEKRASLGLLVSGVAHELNNPLNNISLIAERITEDGEYLVTQDSKGLHNIITQCERAKHIVNDLLDFARARKTTEMEKLDIVMVIEDSFNLVGNELRINNINLEMDIPDTAVYVYGNRSKLEQVFVSIITNAIQAMIPDGTITVRLSPHDEDNNILVNISDTGPGIAKKDIKNIFEPFFTTKPVGEGTGLGLSVCRSLIQEHKGEIEVDSTPGKGTTFTINLPLYREVS